MPGYGGGDPSGDDPGGDHGTTGDSGNTGMNDQGGYMGLGIGNPGSYGGTTSGLSDPDSGNVGYHNALAAVNDPADVALADSMDDTLNGLSLSLGWSKAKAAFGLLSGLLSLNLGKAVAGLTGLFDTEEEEEAVENAVTAISDEYPDVDKEALGKALANGLHSISTPDPNDPDGEGGWDLNTELLATGFTQDEIDSALGADSSTTTEDSTTSASAVDEGLWSQFLERATTDLEDLIQDNADFTSAEATQAVTDTQAANDANSAVLAKLQSDLINEKGTFTPAQTSWGGYQPGTNFIKAQSLMSLADGIKDNTLNTVAAQQSTVQDRSPYTSTLQFLASLQDIAETDQSYALDKYRADLGLTGTQYTSDAANETSTLDNIISAVDTGTAISDLISSWSTED